MPPYIKITGNSISESEKEKVLAMLKNVESENLAFQEGEMEKDKTKQDLIALANKYISELFEDLGLVHRAELTLQHYHFLDEGAYVKRFHNLSEGLYDDKTFSIYVDYFEIFLLNPFFLFEVILHETLHAASFHHIDVMSLGNSSTDSKWIVKQSGYGQREMIGDKTRTYYYGLNEMIDAGICKDIADAKSSEVLDLLKDGKYTPTESYASVLKETIFDGIAKKKLIDRKEIWRIFQRALFDGNTSEPFELIESSFGSEALEVLKYFFDKTPWAGESTCCSALATYFETDDSSKKNEAKNYLSVNCAIS